MTAEERTKLIESKKKKADHPERLWCRDEWRLFDVWRVPVDALLLNIENRRFAAERKLVEEKLGRALDPENSQVDEESVVAILLYANIDVDGDRVVGKPSKDYDALRKDWENRKQETPFWIRPDGTVRNGNRRLAMVKRLRIEKGADGREYVDAIVLDKDDISEDDLFEMEQREQLTENLKVRYTDINLLLSLKEAAEARDIDWVDSESIETVAAELQHLAGGDQVYAAIQLQAIRYMDAYLEDSSATGQYQKLLRQVERFRDVGKLMARIEQDFADDAPDILKLAFAAIRAGNPHGDIRAIRKMFIEDKARYRKLLKQVEKEEEKWEEERGPSLEDPVLAAPVAEPGDDDDDAEVPGPVVPNYPGEKVMAAIKNAIDGMNATALDVPSTIEQALNRLESLTTVPGRLEKELDGDQGEAIRDGLKRVVTWADDIKKILKAK